MDNEFGYIDDKPFEECYKEKQIISLINTDEKGIEFKVTGNNKFSIFDIGNSLKEIHFIIRFIILSYDSFKKKA